MQAVVVSLLLALGLATPASAQVQLFFNFDWISSATFSTLVPVNRVEPDGSITPYDQVRTGGTQSGSGVLTLTQPVGQGGGYAFQFSGVGGAGGGQSDADGTIRPGGIVFPVPSDVPLTGSRPFVGGRLELVGDPAQPSGLSISYYDGASPHCVFECSALEFHGTGRSVVAASESSPVVLLALGLGLLLGLRRRARS